MSNGLPRRVACGRTIPSRALPCWSTQMASHTWARMALLSSLTVAPPAFAVSLDVSFDCKIKDQGTSLEFVLVNRTPERVSCEGTCQVEEIGVPPPKDDRHKKCSVRPRSTGSLGSVKSPNGWVAGSAKPVLVSCSSQPKGK